MIQDQCSEFGEGLCVRVAWRSGGLGAWAWAWALMAGIWWLAPFMPRNFRSVICSLSPLFPLNAISSATVGRSFIAFVTLFRASPWRQRLAPGAVPAPSFSLHSHLVPLFTRERFAGGASPWPLFCPVRSLCGRSSQISQARHSPLHRYDPLCQTFRSFSSSNIPFRLTPRTTSRRSWRLSLYYFSARGRH